MQEIRLRAPGKINWTLDVLRKRPDGYHEVEMLMQSIALSDEVILRRRQEGLSICSDAPGMPLDSSNIAVKAAQLMKDTFNIPEGIEIHIKKQIPIAAGLAGGSTDGAAVLAGLNALWDLGLSQEALAEFGVRLGADVPFCLYGGTAIARGIGEELTLVPAVNDLWLVLVKPPFGVSTPRVYQGLVLDKIGKRPDLEKTYAQLAAGEVAAPMEGMANVLEQVTIPWHPEIEGLKARMVEEGAAASLMSGSGPTVYGLFSSREGARAAHNRLEKDYPQAILTQTWNHGVEIVEGGRQWGK